MTLTRRRFLTISAAASVFPAGVARAETPSNVHRWRGVAFGAEASIALIAPDKADARQVLREVEREVARLESLFSLYREDSDLSRLNRDGKLVAPAPEMLALLSLSSSVHRATQGAFDPSVQTLWRLYAAAAATDRAPEAAALAKARDHTGWPHVRYDPAAIEFARSGMALTFNGIAQGYAADRVADLLRARGYENVLIDMGEVNARGRKMDAAPWRAGVSGVDGALVREVSLSDRALATSAPQGTLLDPKGRTGHIIDPRSGAPSGTWSLVSVSAARAATADALSTAFCVMTRADIERAIADFPDAEIEVLI